MTTINRRDMLKLGLAAGGAVLLCSGSQLAPARANQPVPNRHPTGGVFPNPSPKVEHPFSQHLLRMPRKTHLPGGAADLARPENEGVLPNGTVYPQITGVDALTTYSHSLERIVALQQRNSGNNVQFPPQKFYVLKVQQNNCHVFHSQPPYDQGSVIWGYDGLYPGPTFESRHGEPVLVRIVNELFFDKNVNRPEGIFGGFGDAHISTHLHNGHTGSESDGNPADVYPPLDVPKYLPQYPKSIQDLKFRDHHYAMFRAGLDPTATGAGKNDGDVAESLSTLWYHDHSHHKTAENTYKGLVGFHLVFDEIDSGDENDPAPALKLPSGEFDVPLLFQDKQFRLVDGKAQLHLPKLNDPDFSRDGVLGDIFLVNGRIQPKLDVKRRKYRFRLLNAGPSRFYKFFLVKQPDEHTPPEYQTFFWIGNDESLLERRYETKPEEGLLLSVAERSDIVIDFERFTAGDKLYLVNRLVMDDAGFGPVPVRDANGTFIEFKTLPADESEGKGDYVLLFEVVGGDVDDPSDVPEELRKNPVLPPELFVENTNDLKSPDDLKKLPNHRCFQFQQDENTAQWVINGRPFATSPAGAAAVRAGKLDVPRNNALPGVKPDGEVWTIKNGGSGWAHPVHIHLEEFQILLRNGVRPPLYERSKKDVLRLDPDEEVQIFLRFRDFLGKYPIHCHNVLHEDHEMMLRFDVVGEF